MSDLPAMDPCPCNTKGRHELNVVLPETSDLDMTLFCSHCGALRRVGVSGSLMVGSLDDQTPDVIKRAVWS